MPDSEQDDFAQRAASRSHWVGRKTTLLESSGEDDLSSSTTIEERLGMMWQLACSAWSFTGEPLPRYARSQMPGRILRPDRR